MELEELKHIWKAHTAEAIEQQEVNAHALREMIHQRSQAALRQINRNIWIELSLVMLLGLGIWGWFYVQQGILFTWQLLPLWIYMLAAGVFYMFKYKLLNREPLGNISLKDSLHYLSRTMGKFMKLYYVMAFVVLPLVGSIFFVLGINLGLEMQGGRLSDITLLQWAIMGGVMVTYLAVVIVGTRWYVAKIYGLHYQTILNCLEELTEE